MTNDELITIKSREITRLHNVCNSKDRQIELLIHTVEYLKGICDPDLILEDYNNTLNCILQNAKESIG